MVYKISLLLFLALIIVGCASIEGQRDKSMTTGGYGTEVIDSIAVLPIRENPALPNLSSQIEAYLPFSIHDRLRHITVLDSNTFISNLKSTDMISAFAQWKSTYEATSILDPKVSNSLSSAAKVRYFLLIHGANLSRERIRGVDTGYSGWVKNADHVWRTDLKVPGELIDMQEGKVIWKGVGWAEHIDSVRRDINIIGPYVTYSPETVKEISKYIAPMVKMACDGIGTQLQGANKAFMTKDPQVRTESPQLSTTASPSSVPSKKTGSKEYWSWGLGVAVKTDQSTTVTEFDDVSKSTAKTCLKIGDEIVKIGNENLVNKNAYQILTKELPAEEDNLITVVVRRDGNEVNCRIRPNKFK